MSTIEKALEKSQADEQRETQSAPVEPIETAAASSIEAADIANENQSTVSGDYPVSKKGVSAKKVKQISRSGVTENSMSIDKDMLIRIGAIVPDDKRSRIKEEYKHIKRPLLQRANPEQVANQQANLIMITSAYSGEGKTFSSLNLALSIAVERDRRVLLVDADVVKPGLGRMLGVEDKAGLVEYLNGDIDALSEIMIGTDINNLTILPAGKTHHLSHELLASNAMYELASELSSRYPDRIIIIDSPPVLITSEAKVLSQIVGQIALVVEQDRTSQSAVNDALAVLSPEAKSAV